VNKKIHGGGRTQKMMETGKLKRNMGPVPKEWEKKKGDQEGAL